MLLPINILPKQLESEINNKIKEYKEYNDTILNKSAKNKSDENSSDNELDDKPYKDELDDECLYDKPYKDELDDKCLYDKFGNEYNIYNSNTKNANRFDDINDIGNNKKKIKSYLKNYY
jgi:hypothetical protein